MPHVTGKTGGGDPQQALVAKYMICGAADDIAQNSQRAPGPGNASRQRRVYICQGRDLVEPRGIEPLTSSLRTTRSPN